MSAVLKDHAPTLYELQAEYMESLAILADADAPPEVVFDTLDAMQGDITEKVNGVLSYAANMQAIADARVAEAARLTKSAKALAAKADNMRTYVQIALMNCGIKLPLVTSRFTVNMAKNPPSSEVYDEAKLPATYKSEAVEIIAPVGIGEAIKGLIAAGSLSVQFPGASIHVETKVDKRSLLDDLKTVAEANAAKAEGEQRDAIPGARLQPQTFRLTVR